MPGTKQLMAAIESEPIWKVAKLLKKMDLDEVNRKKNGETALHLACREKYNEAVDLLVAKNGVDVNVKDSGGKTPLQVAIDNDNGHAVTKILTHPQVDVNIQDSGGSTPLHWACGRNLHQVVWELLSSPGIHVNVRGKHDDTPVMWAATLCNEETLKLMLEDSRVNLDAKDEYGRGLEVLCRQNKAKNEYERGLAGFKDSKTRQNCVQMICDERRNREHNEEKEQQSKFNKEMEDLEDKWKKSFDIGNMEGNGEKGEGILVPANEELMEGNGGEVKEEGSEGTVNEDIIEGTGEEDRKEGSVASDNEPKEEKKNDKEMEYSRLCWFCSKEDCKLYKCGGCRKARYCSEECIAEDWEVHGNWCKKEQKRRNKMQEEDQKAEGELKSPLDLE